jgi:hypothetical protein
MDASQPGSNTAALWGAPGDEHQLLQQQRQQQALMQQQQPFLSLQQQQQQQQLGLQGRLGSSWGLQGGTADAAAAAAAGGYAMGPPSGAGGGVGFGNNMQQQQMSGMRGGSGGQAAAGGGGGDGGGLSLEEPLTPRSMQDAVAQAGMEVCTGYAVRWLLGCMDFCSLNEPVHLCWPMAPHNARFVCGVWEVLGHARPASAAVSWQLTAKSTISKVFALCCLSFSVVVSAVAAAAGSCCVQLRP